MPIFFTKIARTGERVRRMAYAYFSNAITCAWFFIKKHAQVNVVHLHGVSEKWCNLKRNHLCVLFFVKYVHAQLTQNNKK